MARQPTRLHPTTAQSVMMNLNYIGLLAVCLSVAAFKIAYTQAIPATTGKRWIAFLFFGIIGFPALLAAIYYLHLIPEKLWFYELRSWRGSEFFIVATGASIACLASFFPRKFVSTFLLILVGIGVLPYLKPIIVPLPAHTIKDEWRGETCIQSTPSTCGPASIATIMRIHGMQASEREIAHAAHTYAGGTEAWYLARYVRSRGLPAHFDFRHGLPQDTALPAMIGVRLGHSGHFIAVLSRHEDLLEIADPLIGKETISLHDLEMRYTLTGFHLSIPLSSTSPTQ